MKKFTSLKETVEAMENGKKINGKFYPLFIIQEMQDIQALKINKSYETITKEVADICILCGLTVKNKGIGWIITKKADKLLGAVYC